MPDNYCFLSYLEKGFLCILLFVMPSSPFPCVMPSSPSSVKGGLFLGGLFPIIDVRWRGITSGPEGKLLISPCTSPPSATSCSLWTS